MRLAFGIVSMFPGGGLQRDCAALARIVRDRGHAVTIFAARVDGDIGSDLAISLLPNHAWTNHGRNLRFASDLARACAGRFDRIVGFNKMPGLDVLYCADPPFDARAMGALRRWLPRERTMRALETACFAPGRATRLLLLSAPQVAAYRAAWNTEPGRIALLPPTTDARRRQPRCRSDGTRERVRAALGVSPHDWLWLAVASQPRVKGLDRTLAALAAFPEARLAVAGIDERSPRRPGTPLGEDRIARLGFREDIPDLMAAADLLVHPARLDVTAGVILEAVANGLPVVASAVCGYAGHIEAADAGLVVPEPFERDRFVAALRAARDPGRRAAWSANAVRYGETADLYGGLERAASLILGEG